MAVSQKNFDEAVKILTEKLDAVIRSQRDINKSIQSLTGEIATLKKDASDRDIKIGQLEKELEDQNYGVINWRIRLSELKQQVEQRFSKMETTLPKEVSDLEKIITENDSLINELIQAVEFQKEQFELQRLLHLEVGESRHNLLLQGLPKEKKDESLELKVRTVLKDKLGLVENVNITRMFLLKEKLSSVSQGGKKKQFFFHVIRIATLKLL
ncbi:hypothetical protein QYM36_012165 [Artemia franciscana]|uniref:Uncharacterized protein n=1 Tax=Artemia franciscana TaxID=6661 RepID=A0AA88HGH4_ARTSF|nr:hypothetical protein QYM36_012165 [Artemia franciscana]